jgi:hypothetical protein
MRRGSLDCQAQGGRTAGSEINKQRPCRGPGSWSVAVTWSVGRGGTTPNTPRYGNTPRHSPPRGSCSGRASGLFRPGVRHLSVPIAQSSPLERVDCAIDPGQQHGKIHHVHQKPHWSPSVQSQGFGQGSHPPEQLRLSVASQVASHGEFDHVPEQRSAPHAAWCGSCTRHFACKRANQDTIPYNFRTKRGCGPPAARLTRAADRSRLLALPD